MSSKPKILADENIPRTAIQTLRSSGYDVLSIWEINPGMSDEQVVQFSIREKRIIITFDKDFGRIALTNPDIPGVMLLRIPPANSEYITNQDNLGPRKCRKSLWQTNCSSQEDYKDNSIKISLVGPRGFEPRTSAASGRRPNRARRRALMFMCYATIIFMYGCF